MFHQMFRLGLNNDLCTTKTSIGTNYVALYVCIMHLLKNGVINQTHTNTVLSGVTEDV